MQQTNSLDSQQKDLRFTTNQIAYAKTQFIQWNIYDLENQDSHLTLD